MFDALWSMVTTVTENPATTKLWRTIVIMGLLLIYLGGISFASWVFLDLRDIRVTYSSKNDHDAKCLELREHIFDSISQIRIDICDIRKGQADMKQLLLEKFLDRPSVSSTKESSHDR